MNVRKSKERLNIVDAAIVTVPTQFDSQKEWLRHNRHWRWTIRWQLSVSAGASWAQIGQVFGVTELPPYIAGTYVSTYIPAGKLGVKDVHRPPELASVSSRELKAAS